MKCRKNIEIIVVEEKGEVGIMESSSKNHRRKLNKFVDDFRENLGLIMKKFRKHFSHRSCSYEC